MFWCLRDDQKTPSTEIFIEDNRLTGIIIFSDSYVFIVEGLQIDANGCFLFCSADGPVSAIVLVDNREITSDFLLCDSRARDANENSPRPLVFLHFNFTPLNL